VGLETGEMEFGCYGGHVASKYSFLHGHELEPLCAEMAQYTTAMRRYRQEMARNSHLPWHQAALNLTEPTERPHLLRGEVLNAAQARAALDAVNDRMAISNTLTAELILGVIFEEFADAVAAGTEGQGFLDSVLSQFNQPAHLFFDALARLERWHQVPAGERAALREVAEASLAALKGWAEAGPVNLAQKVALLEAELLAIDGRTMAAREPLRRGHRAVPAPRVPARRGHRVGDGGPGLRAPGPVRGRAPLSPGRARHLREVGGGHEGRCDGGGARDAACGAADGQRGAGHPRGIGRTVRPTSSTRQGEALDLVALFARPRPSRRRWC
jgi:hypothetical protein